MIIRWEQSFGGVRTALVPDLQLVVEPVDQWIGLGYRGDWRWKIVSNIDHHVLTSGKSVSQESAKRWASNVYKTQGDNWRGLDKQRLSGR